MDNYFEKDMQSMPPSLDGIDLMGKNIAGKVKFCGEGVRLYPLCKMIHCQNAELDNYCQIMDYAFIDAGKSLQIGKYSTITWHCLLEGGANIKIGDRVFIGPGTKILSSTYELDGFYAIEHIPIQCRQTRFGDITINDDAYIGANSVVLPGVTIGEGAVVGACSLVNRNLKPWGVYFGNPVKLVGERERPTEERKKILESLDWSKHL
jgi:acetyltransferase-like isoleucine patch superfamily enzyme